MDGTFLNVYVFEPTPPQSWHKKVNGTFSNVYVFSNRKVTEWEILLLSDQAREGSDISETSREVHAINPSFKAHLT